MVSAVSAARYSLRVRRAGDNGCRSRRFRGAASSAIAAGVGEGRAISTVAANSTDRRGFIQRVGAVCNGGCGPSRAPLPARIAWIDAIRSILAGLALDSHMLRVNPCGARRHKGQGKAGGLQQPRQERALKQATI
jgi:hypothetical protein